MYRLLSIVGTLAVFYHVAANPSGYGRSEEVLATCRDTYTAELSNDFLLGEWFQVMRYTFFGGYVPSSSCPNNIITKATAENLTAYNDWYGVTFSLEDNPVLINYADWALNLLTGHVEAKDHYAQPGFAPTHSVYNYKKLTDDYILVWDCALRGMTIWLHSRVRHPTNEEIASVTNGVAEVSRLEGQRYCA